MTSPVPSHVPSHGDRASHEERRARVIARIGELRRRAQKASWQDIADAFNREGLATLSGRGRWDKSTIYSLWKKYGQDGST